MFSIDHSFKSINIKPPPLNKYEWLIRQSWPGHLSDLTGSYICRAVCCGNQNLNDFNKHGAKDE